MACIHRIVLVLGLLAAAAYPPQRALAKANPEQIERLSELAARYREAGDFTRAIARAEKAAKLAETGYGAVSKEHATLLNRLAGIYREAARWNDAEQAYVRALEIRETVDPPGTITIANNLGILYWEMSRYGDAEPLLKRALETYQRTRGAKDPFVAVAQTNLGLLYLDLGRYEDARKHLTDALAVRKAALGTKDPAVANSLNNLAAVARLEERDAEAEIAAREALAIREEALGREHREVAYSLNVLAWVLTARGRYDEAEPLLDRALAIRRKRLGPDHPDIATNQASLGGVYEGQGRLEQAERGYLEALALRERRLGGSHLLVAATRNDLGALYKTMGRYEEAEPLLKTALEVREKAFGATHPAVIKTLALLGELYRLRGMPDAAKTYFDRVLATRRAAIHQVPVLYATNRDRRGGTGGVGYGAERSETVSFGLANVWVPTDKAVALSAGSVATEGHRASLDETTEVGRLVIQHIAEMDGGQLVQAVRAKATDAQLFSGQVLVFVHGFNVSFENAVKRAAQISRDLRFDGATVLFSWPSRGGDTWLESARGVANYTYDRASADAAINHLRALLRMLAVDAGARKIHLIAHSMGNHALLESLERISINPAAIPGLKLGEVICAAPDVDATRFRQLVPPILSLGANITLYASSADKALLISRTAWGAAERAGSVPAKDGPIVMRGLDTIDITAAGSNPIGLNHDIYARNSVISEDMRIILENSLRPPGRRSAYFEMKPGKGGPYWAYRPGKKVAEGKQQ